MTGPRRLVGQRRSRGHLVPAALTSDRSRVAKHPTQLRSRGSAVTGGRSAQQQPLSTAVGSECSDVESHNAAGKAPSSLPWNRRADTAHAASPFSDQRWSDMPAFRRFRQVECQQSEAHMNEFLTAVSIPLPISGRNAKSNSSGRFEDRKRKSNGSGSFFLSINKNGFNRKVVHICCVYGRMADCELVMAK